MILPNRKREDQVNRIPIHLLTSSKNQMIESIKGNRLIRTHLEWIQMGPRLDFASHQIIKENKGDRRKKEIVD